jgi:glycosyltransferase involved in cell wall biosynthesis
MTLSVIMPVYNEAQTIETIVERVIHSPCDKQIIMVDDGSTDGTRDLLGKLQEKYPHISQCLFHPCNLGKGAAIRTGLAAATGDVIVIQDADLEYHPEDYPAALRLIAEGWADAVYGSRFLGPHRVFLFWHYLAEQMSHHPRQCLDVGHPHGYGDRL